jgi:16S rRNA (cytidine1402-2'-O)-methyltransferase
VAREISKRYEEFIRGSVAELNEALADREVKGEVTVLLGPPPKKAPS